MTTSIAAAATSTSSLGPKLIDPPEGPRTNHFVIEELAKRLGVARYAGLRPDRAQHIDYMLGKRGLGELRRASRRAGGPTCSRISRPRTSSTALPIRRQVPLPAGLDRARRAEPAAEEHGHPGPRRALPEFPDHVDLIEDGGRRASVPPRHLAGALRSSIRASPKRRRRRAREGRPELMIHPDDAGAARHRRRRPRRDRQRARRGRAACQAV